MRRELIYILLALLLGGAIGTLAMLDRGYVRIEIADWIVESNFIVFLALLMVGYVVLRFFFALLRGGERFRRLWQRKQSGKAKARAREGMLLFASGRWAEAAERLENAADKSFEPVTVWLSAGAAARKAGDAAKGRACLAQARSLTGDVPELVLLEARWDLEDREAQQAVSRLRELPEPDDAKVNGRKTLLLAQAFLELEDWSSLSNTLQDLRKAKHVEAAEYRGMEVALASSAFDVIERQAASTGLAPLQGDIDAAWKQVPKALRNEPSLIRRKKEIEAPVRAD